MEVLRPAMFMSLNMAIVRTLCISCGDFVDLKFGGGMSFVLICKSMKSNKCEKKLKLLDRISLRINNK